MFAPQTNIKFFHDLTKFSVAVLVVSAYCFKNYKTEDWRMVVEVAGIILGFAGIVIGVLMPDEVRYLAADKAARAKAKEAKELALTEAGITQNEEAVT